MLLAFSFTPFLLGLYILVTWGVCAAVLIGMGALLLHTLVGNHRPLDAFWAGLFVTVLLLQCAHFFVPMGWPVTALLGTLGVAGLAAHGKSYFSPGGTYAPRESGCSALLCSLPIAYAIALRCVGPCEHYDTGFYGAMAVRWFNTYPLAPGLANLMAQFGYNSSVFLCVAGLSHGPWQGLAFHLFSGLLLSALAFAVVPAFCRVWRGSSFSHADLFLSILVIPGTFWATNTEIVGTNTDLPTTFVGLTAFAYLLKACARSKTNGIEEPPEAPVLLAALLFSLAASFKISSIVFSFLGWALAVAQLWNSAFTQQRRRWVLLAAVSLPAVLMLFWSLRGVFISGYPLFPSSFLGMPVDWRVPREWTNFHARNVQSWARIAWAPLSETEGWRWVHKWFHGVVRNRVDFIFPALFCFAGIVALLWRREWRVARWLWVLLPSVTGLFFWFCSAPAIRFGEPMIWSTAGTLGAAALLGVVTFLGKRARQVLLLGFVLIGLWCSYPRTLWRVFYRPAFEQRELPRLPEVPLAPYKLNADLTVLVPYKKNQCWDAPLPCSPYFFDSLRLRRDSNLRSGFSDRQASGEVNKSGAFHKRYWTEPEPDSDQ